MRTDTLVFTSYPSAWNELAAVTCESHFRWTQKHGYDYHADCSDMRDNFYNFNTKGSEVVEIKGFIKLDLFLHFLPRYKRLLWIDADALITNMERPIEYISNGADLVLPYDWNGHNATVIFANSTPNVHGFMWACNNTGRKLYLGHDWKEMEAMRYFLQTPPYRNLASYRSIKTLCGILPEEYEGAGVPRAVMEPYAWAPADWCLHLSALPVHRRIEIARRVVSELCLAT